MCLQFVCTLEIKQTFPLLVHMRLMFSLKWSATWRVNNPRLWCICVSMIGRADIEGSASNIAMNAWPHGAPYCGRHGRKQPLAQTHRRRLHLQRRAPSTVPRDNR